MPETEKPKYTTVYVEVTDLLFRQRRAPIPLKCPKCGQDFTEEGSILIYQYDLSDRHVQVKDGELNWDDHIGDPAPEPTDYISEASCKRCLTVLASSKERRDDDALSRAFDKPEEGE